MKRILFISVIPGNMEALLDYYSNMNKHEYKIEIMNCYNFYNKRIKGLIYKIPYILKRYDLVISDYPTELLALGKKKIYMNHGSGLKIMPGKNEFKEKKVIRVSKAIADADIFNILSPREENILYSWLPYLKEKKINFECLGQPRNDKLFNKEYKNNAKLDVYNKFNIDLNEKLLLLAPTWRGYQFDFTKFFNNNDLNILNEFLKKNKITLMYRPHYLEDIVGCDRISKFEKFIVADNKSESDAQKILAATDYLITDFSGILTEYLAINKPVIFLDLDVEIYQNFRGLAINYYNDIHTPGPKIKDIKELIKYLEDNMSNNDSYKIFREKAIKYYYEYYDGNSCERIWDMINKILME